RRRLLAAVETTRDLDQRAQAEVEIESRLVLHLLLGGAQQSVEVLVDEADFDAEEDDHPQDLDGDEKDYGQSKRAVDQIEAALDEMVGVDPEAETDQRE